MIPCGGVRSGLFPSAIALRSGPPARPPCRRGLPPPQPPKEKGGKGWRARSAIQKAFIFVDRRARMPVTRARRGWRRRRRRGQGKRRFLDMAPPRSTSRQTGGEGVQELGWTDGSAHGEPNNPPLLPVSRVRSVVAQASPGATHGAFISVGRRRLLGRGLYMCCAFVLNCVFVVVVLVKYFRGVVKRNATIMASAARSFFRIHSCCHRLTPGLR